MYQENNTFYDETPFQYGFSSIEEIIQRIKGEIKAKKFKIPKSMANKELEKKHRKLINKILD